MPPDVFEQIVAEEFPNAVPEKFQNLIRNVAFVVEDEPDELTRKEEGLRQGETLLGHYRGIPATARGDMYGMGATLPDCIVLYKLPIEEEAASLFHSQAHSSILQNTRIDFELMVRKVVRDTIWHEVAHAFGYDEHQVRRKEQERDS